jgi:phenylpropionate dioxygenase-like ring-hydroxylating dioxygenase large terminal subunit
MFIHQTQLRHLLRPDQYFSEEQHLTEQKHLFQTAWHPVASTRQLNRPGDFLSCELMGTPVLVRNFEGELRAFLNVCPHRHSRLTDKAAGNTERLRCQYHGWEFNKEGRTGHIPDARAFRPWDRENSCLRPFRVESCGEAVFVCLGEAAVSLREWLGPLWERWETSFGGNFQYALSWSKDFPCNWKVVLENSLESYHIPLIHPKTFGEFPPEENAWHELDPRFSTFKTIVPSDWVNRRQDHLVRMLGEPVTREYCHHVRHPHLSFSSLDVNRILFAVYPLGPTTCRYWMLLYTLRGRRRNPLAWAMARLLRPIVKAIGMRVIREDASIYGEVQRGLTSSPHRGVIGTREERIYVFQDYVKTACEGARELRVIEDIAQAK